MKGNVVLAKYKNAKIVVDLHSLSYFRGDRLSVYRTEKSASRLLDLFTLILIAVPVGLLVLQGNLGLDMFLNPTSLLTYLPFLGIYTFIIALFLRRNRDKFDTSIKKFDLLKKVKQIESGKQIELYIDEFMDFETLVIIDKTLVDNNYPFIVNLTRLLIEHKEIQYFLKNRLGVNVDKFIELLKQNENSQSYKFSDAHKTLFLYLFDEAIKIESNSINKFILFFVLNKYFLKPIYFDLGVSELELEGLRVWFKNETKQKEYYERWEKLSKLKPKGDVNRAYTSRVTPVLDEYSEDFTKEAATGYFMLTIGKEQEMARLLQSMERGRATACMVLGDPGVGKTRFIRHLATRMVVEDIPNSLYDHRLLVVDLNKVLTQVGSVDIFKQTLQKMFEEVRYSGNIILVLEEFTQILNIREDSKLEVVNLITNAIDALNLKIIATTNNANYSKYVKPIKTLAASFDVVHLKEPASNVALQILIDEVPRIEKKYKTSVRVNALKRIVEFAPKFDQDRVMPDKGIDLLEEACLAAKNQGLAFLDVATVDEVLSDRVGVKVGNLSESESQTLMNLSIQMHERVVGQQEAIDAVASAIKRSRSGLSAGKKPIASFLFYGPTGVGKTEVARTLADIYYGSENLMIRLDMSEYQEEQNLNRIIGYTDDKGNFIGGYLTEAVRTRPFSLILLDEIEKANKKVLDLFLQVLDEGTLKDGMGRKIDFTNTIIIMTSNIGSNLIANEILKGQKYHEVEKLVGSKLQESFRIEFLNRFDKLIMFKPLSKIEIEQIVTLMLKKINDNLMQRGISFLWNERTLSELSERGFSPTYGARELKRIIQENIEDKLADLIIQGKLRSGMEAVFDGLTVRDIVN